LKNALFSGLICELISEEAVAGSKSSKKFSPRNFQNTPTFLLYLLRSMIESLSKLGRFEKNTLKFWVRKYAIFNGIQFLKDSSKSTRKTFLSSKKHPGPKYLGIGSYIFH
jgi:hypothetical protein